MSSKQQDNENFVKFIQDRLGLKIDGWAGKVTREKIAPFLPQVEVSNSGLEVDERSEKNILTLHPKIQNKAREFVIKANQYLNPFGIHAKIISGTRTYEEQDKLYRQAKDGKDSDGDGRIDESDELVTKAPAGFSNHNFSVAMDFGLFNGADYLENSPYYLKVAQIGKSLGFLSGADWKSMKDEPHLEWPTGLTLAQMRERVKIGKDVLG